MVLLLEVVRSILLSVHRGLGLHQPSRGGGGTVGNA